MKNFLKKDLIKYVLLLFTLCITFFMVVAIFNQKEVKGFFQTMENKSFDLRQSIISKNKAVNRDIMIIAVDDASYEFLLDKYGEWPVPREVYADVIRYLEKQNPVSIAFDLMFVKSLKSKTNSDEKLAKAIADHENTFVAMNFDHQSFDLRTPPVLPDYLKVNIQNDSDVRLKNSSTEYSNCRAILQEIIDTTKNIGHINLIREDDGIARKVPIFVSYKNDFYPHLALMVALNYLQRTENIDIKNFKIDKDGNLNLGSRSIPLDNLGSATLNWYGESGRNEGSKNFTYVPFWKIIKSMDSDNPVIPDNYFKNKIIYVGTSAMSLYDIKSTPTERYLPGVELHTTLVNNILDNNFIKKLPNRYNYLICIALWFLVCWIIYKTESTIFSITLSVMVMISYLIFSIVLMNYYNLWIGNVLQVASIILAVITTYIIKYVLKSRDFEYTYKLATTDGLTELYNHRFFQEQMIINIENAKRYNNEFSLILIDIDFFKKFNDKFGHQSGDAVLKQVAQVLKRTVRTTDIVCRYGGEEMAIILSNTDKDEAKITANKICKAVREKPFKLQNNEESTVTVSLGVSTYPKNGITPTELIEHADKCLYAAKENGRNQVGEIE